MIYAIFTKDILNIIPEIYFIFSIIITLIYGIFLSNKCILLSNKKFDTPIVIFAVTNLVIFSLIILIILFCTDLHITETLIFHGSFTLNYYTQIGKILILIMSIICLLTFNFYFKEYQTNNYENVILLQISIFSICLLLNANDLLHYFVIIELQSLCFYTITALKKNNVYATESSLKYFIFGAVISSIFLLSAALLYGITGLSNFNEIAILLTTGYNNIVVFICYTLIYATLLFKLTVAPYHIWAVDVYNGAPSIITLFFNTVPKFSLIVVFIKFVYLIFATYANFMQIFISLNIIMSLIITAFGAFKQYQMKRFLIYSSMTHVSYMLIGLATGTIEGIQSIFIYFIIYIISVYNIWSIYLYFDKKLKYLSDLPLLYTYNKAMCLSFIIALFSMAGIPPMGGFIAKFYAILNCMQNEHYSLAYFSVCISILCVFYYIKLVRSLFFGRTKFFFNPQNISKILAIIVSITAILILYFFFCPANVFILAHKLALNLCL